MTIPYFTGWVIDHAVAGTIPIEQITTAGALLFGVQFGSNFFRSGSTVKLIKPSGQGCPYGAIRGAHEKTVPYEHIW